jgi:hypothetical protein
MPGSGPIDPDNIFQAIHNGAVYSNGLLDGQWCRANAVWELSAVAGDTLHADAYRALYTGTVSGGIITASGQRYQLASVNGEAVLAAP